MTQAWRPDFSQPDDPSWNAAPAPAPAMTPAEMFAGARVLGMSSGPAQPEHAVPLNTAVLTGHHVLRLDNGDAERFPRLAALVAMYDAAKSAADAAAATLKTITDGIKAETSAAIPGGTDFTIVSGSLAHPLTLQYVVSNRVDTKALRAMLTAEQYASLTKPSGSWTLKPKRG